MDEKELFEKIDNVMAYSLGEQQKNRLNGFIKSRITLLSCHQEQTPSSVFLYEVEDFELNHYDGVHGGFTCSLFDVCVANTCCAYTNSLLTTTDLHVQYLRPLPKGKYRVITEITHAGQTLVSAIGKIVSENSDEIYAVCTVSYMKVQEGYRIMQQHTP